ncbi:hypothetical protein JOM56_013932 [Amanita muscaria]
MNHPQLSDRPPPISIDRPYEYTAVAIEDDKHREEDLSMTEPPWSTRGEILQPYQGMAYYPYRGHGECVNLAHSSLWRATISAYTCTLILAYAALVNNAATRTDRRYIAGGIPYNLCMLFALLAIIMHSGIIILSCRATVLCCCKPDNLDSRFRAAAFFASIVTTCEYLRIGGTVFFLLAVWASSLLLFDHVIYPGVFSALSLFALVMLAPKKYGGMEYLAM